ncbi:hypothetical protein [Bordetella trematum]|uniref:hypothetical protein n=1 Tax=Bordetella trematum TaxID=123899 RepID=UPI0015C56BA8|nr:hypothetical protein [Bordetella trematum]
MSAAGAGAGVAVWIGVVFLQPLLAGTFMKHGGKFRACLGAEAGRQPEMVLAYRADRGKKGDNDGIDH